MGKKRSFFVRAVITLAAIVMVFGSSGISSAVENLNTTEENTKVKKEKKETENSVKDTTKKVTKGSVKPAAFTTDEYKVSAAFTYNASWPYNNIIGRNVDIIKNGTDAGLSNYTINGGFSFYSIVNKTTTGYGVNGDTSGAANVVLYNDVLNFGSDSSTVERLDSNRAYLKNITVPTMGDATKITIYGKGSAGASWTQLYSQAPTGSNVSLNYGESNKILYTKVVYEGVSTVSEAVVSTSYGFTTAFLSTLNAEDQNTYPHTVSMEPGVTVQNANTGDWAWKYNGSTYQIPDASYPTVNKYEQIGAAYSVQQSIDTKLNRVAEGNEVLRAVHHFRIMNWLSFQNQPSHNPNPVKFTKKSAATNNKDRYETNLTGMIYSPGSYQNLPVNELTYVFYLPKDFYLGDLKVGDSLGSHAPYGTFTVGSIKTEMVNLGGDSRQKVTIGMNINSLEYMYGPHHSVGNIPIYTENIDKFTSYTDTISLTYPTRMVVGGYDQLQRDHINNTGYWYKDAGDANTPDSSKLVDNGKNDWVFGVDAGFTFPKAVKVTYDANGGTGSVVDEKVYPKTQDVVVKSDSGISRDGYVFAGWKVGDTVYQPNDKFSITEDTTLVAQWERAAGAAVTVKYVDEAGNEIATSDTLNGKIDDPYTSTAKTIDGWALKTTPANANGKFTTSLQTVTYVYTRAAGAPVTVKYVDEAGNEIATSDTLNGKIDDPYSTTAKTIATWDLKTTPANASGKFTTSAQTVTYVYTRSAGAPVTVKYVDEAGNEISSSNVLNGKVDEVYNTIAKDITNWELKTTPANASGKFTTSPQIVTYVYTKKAGAPVTVRYVDEAGNELAASDTLNGKIDDPYTTSAKAITNWEVKTLPSNATGTFTTSPQIVTYVYTKKAGAPVTVKYVDEAGNEIATSDTLNGKIDDPYSTTAKTIATWDLKTTPANATGKFTTSAQTVTYVYTRSAGAAVTVKYVDEAGNEIATSDTLNGKVDDPYTTTAKTIATWDLKTTPANATGKFTTSVQTVTYVYTRSAGAAVTVKYVDEEGNELATSDTLNGKIDEAYTTSAKTITDWELKTTPANANGKFTTSAQTVTYVYNKKAGADITVKYVDEEGNELATSDTLTGKIHDPYETAAKDITDWNLKTTPDNAKGAFTYDTQTVTYIYQKNAGADITVRYVDEKGNELAESDILTGKIHDPYETAAKNITNWTLITTPDNAKGAFTYEAQTVTYVYTKSDGGAVTVKHVDENDKELASSETFNGKIDDPYETTAKKITGWKFKKVSTTSANTSVVAFAEKLVGESKQAPTTAADKTSGIFTADPQTVTYVYTKEAVAKVTSKTTVKPKKLPRTGDNTQNNVLSILGLISFAGIAVYLNSRKRKA